MKVRGWAGAETDARKEEAREFNTERIEKRRRTQRNKRWPALLHAASLIVRSSLRLVEVEQLEQVADSGTVHWDVGILALP